ncbi:MAG TPA: hypothetical protein VN688_01240, partial [Gemmataceae bacterium]|nr:hypothetical protein [Gemmataceae bacterium]
MKTTKPGRSRVRWALALGLGLAFLPSAVWAEELTKFTGYTRPGNPTGPAGPLPGAVRLVDEGTIGATVYFKVFELGGDESTDPWGTGFKNLETSFVPGQASRGRAIDKLDTTARYLYVYQVINDSYRDAQVKSVAIRLLIPPHLITSWGHFAEKGGVAPARGAGFAMEFDDPDPKKPNLKSMVLPVSTEHPGIADALYRDPAPYFNAPRPYSLSNILLRNKPVPLSVDGEDTGREPERVMLQSMANFEGAPNWLVKDRVQAPGPLSVPLPASNLANPYSNPFSPLIPPAEGTNVADTLRRAPAVVAYWTDDPLRPGLAGFQPGQRSTLFGFTSNFPPVYEDVRVRGNTVLPFRGPLAFVADARSANLRVDG